MSVLKVLCQGFKDRAEGRELKGKRRDDAAIDYFVGAVRALQVIENEHARHVETWLVLVLSVRGFRAVEDVIALEEKGGVAA